MSRKLYLSQHFHSYTLAWITASVAWAAIFTLFANFDHPERYDPAMVILSPMMALIFFMITVFTLNSLGQNRDEQFMVHAIFLCGSIGFGLVSIILRSSVGMIASVAAQSFFIALVLSCVMFYITGTRNDLQQKTLD